MAGYLPFYAAPDDVSLLQERLNADSEIAFIVRDGPGRWKASWRVDDLRGKTMLWHVPAGPLPLLHPEGPDTVIEDPFAGWNEERPGMDRSVPYFGYGWPACILLRLWIPGWQRLPPDFLHISSFTWHGRAAGLSPPPTRRWWQRLRGWVGRHATRVTRCGPLHGAHADIWAFPAALRALEAGMEREDNPWLA
jgi:hypothetical protein